jgi:hypothetical protein
MEVVWSLAFGSRWRDARKAKVSSSSFHNKNQKTLAYWGTRCVPRAPQWANVFSSSFKKKRLLVLG